MTPKSYTVYRNNENHLWHIKECSYMLKYTEFEYKLYTKEELEVLLTNSKLGSCVIELLRKLNDT